MRKLVLINMLTLLRVPLTLMLCMMILLNAYPFLPCIMLLIAIFATDYFDGWLARKYDVQTDLGAKLDVASDFFFIVSACLSWTCLGLFPGWMVGVIILKFMEFLITSYLNQKNTHSAAVFQFDSFGRAAAISFYLLPALVLFLVYCCDAAAQGLALHFVCTVLTCLAAVSSVFRISSLARVKKEYAE